MRLLPGLCAGLLALALSAGAAFAQGSTTTLPVTNASHGTTNIAGQQDATGYYHYRNVVEGLKSDGTPVAVTLDGSDGGLWMHVVNWPGSYTIANFPATQVVSDSSLETSASAIATNTNGAAKDGTDATGVTPPSGGVGIRGWLSGLYNVVKGTLTFKAVDSGGGDATDTTNHALRMNCVTGCSGGGAVTVASGADVTEGTPGDAAYAGSGSATVDSLLKGLYAAVTSTPIPAGSAHIGSINQVDSAGNDATDTTHHAVNVNCVVGCGSTSITSSNYLTSGPVLLSTNSAVTLLPAPGANLYGNVVDFDCSNAGPTPVNITLLNSLGQSLWSGTIPAGGILPKPWKTWIGGANHVAANTAITIQATGPGFYGSYVGTQAVASATYNSTTGFVTLTQSVPPAFSAPYFVTVSGWSAGQLNGTFMVVSTGSSGSSNGSVSYWAPAGLGSPTLTSGSYNYAPPVTCNAQGFASAS